jgi:hypothetical protein
VRYLILLLLTACGSPPTDPADKVPTYVSPKVESVTFKRYRISDTEHMILIDIPDKFVPRRCAVFVDDLTKTSHMNCNFDDAGGALPEDNPE